MLSSTRLLWQSVRPGSWLAGRLAIGNQVQETYPEDIVELGIFRHYDFCMKKRESSFATGLLSDSDLGLIVAG